MVKRKEINFLHKEKKKDFSLRINVQKDWMRDHTSWAPCGIEMKIKGILKSWFWISLHQVTFSILWSRIQDYMLSFMNEVDLCLLLPLYVLYEIQNQIFQHTLPRTLKRLGKHWVGNNLKLMRKFLVTLPMRISIPLSIKAIMGITTTLCDLFISNHSPSSQCWNSTFLGFNT